MVANPSARSITDDAASAHRPAINLADLIWRNALRLLRRVVRERSDDRDVMLEEFRRNVGRVRKHSPQMLVLPRGVGSNQHGLELLFVDGGGAKRVSRAAVRRMAADMLN